MFQHLNLRKIIDAGNYDNGGLRDDKWVVMMKGGGEICDHSISMEDDSINSPSSSLCSSSSDFVEEDDASSSTSSTSSSSNGPLYELSTLMAQLPIKRGLSKFYQREV
ncbi:hypothetical protein Q3G72_022418 [Acer saccharum]|nr:hypothetical protein Q3G72_022418 [Acer saccharum]